MDGARVVSRRGVLRAALRGLAAWVVLAPLFAFGAGARPLFVAVLALLYAVTGALEVAVEGRRARARWAGLAAILLMAWLSPVLAEAQDLYATVVFHGGAHGDALLAAASALRFGSVQQACGYHGSNLLLAAPLVAGAAARLEARAHDPAHRPTMSLAAGALAALAVAGAGATLRSVGAALTAEPSHISPHFFTVLLAVVALLLTPFVIGLGELAGRLEDRLARARLVR